MARPIKPGLDYFPLDTVMDKKVGLLEREFGLKGFAVFVKLLQYIYREDGYYGEWNEDVCDFFADDDLHFGDEAVDHKSKVNLVNEVLNCAIRRGLFDKRMYEDYGILTSHGIQERYLKAKNGGGAKIEEAYSLVNDGKNRVNSEKTGVISKKTGVIKSKTTLKKRKEKKSKEKQIKDIYTSGKPAVVSATAHHFDYGLFADYWNNNVAQPTGIATVRDPSHWTDTRKRNLKARVKAEGEKTVLDVFDTVRQSDFLSGRSTGWQANFDWVLKAGNFQKIADGNYKNRSTQPSQKESYYDKVIRGEA